MSNLIKFHHRQFGEIQIIQIDGKEWLAATQTATTLGYVNPHKAIRDHCRTEGCTIRSVLTEGGSQEMKLIDEGNLYRLIVRSKLPSAEQFERWVFDEVLPSVRKNGAYMTPETIEKTLTNPDFIIQLATQLKEEQQARRFAEIRLDEQRPLVAFAETCMDSDRNMLVREVAKLASKDGIMIGEKRLYIQLREWGLVVQHRTEPTQRAMEMGLFEVIKGVRQTPKGARDWETSKVTPKGQVYIIGRLKREKVSESA